ncbi:MAG: methyl-accepting chemotaxis protein [Myxococcales bacterium]|nr:methyl-accepting chemotaxis protein [Myxococcales bacterium]
MTKSKRRVPMFLKFWVGCSTLATLLIVGGLLVVRAETKMKSRGDYLAKHFKRYEQYQEGLGQAVSSVAAMMANDGQLIAALSLTSPVLPPPQDGAPTPRSATVGASQLAEELFQRVSGKNAVRPDLFVVFDSSKMVWSNPASELSAEDIEELEPVARVRSGQAFHNKVLITEGRAVQLAGVPMRGSAGAVVGGILVGVDVTRYMQQYQEQSDKRVAMQHRLSVMHNGKVVASVMPNALWPELDTQLQEGQWKHAQEGDYERAIINLKQGNFDFTKGSVEGFAGVDSGNVASLFLLRSRENLKGRGPRIPWIEMAIGAVLSLLMASLLAFWITKPIKQFVVQSQLMLEGGGDLNQRIEISSRDETADLARNINKVFARLYNLASEVQGAAFHVGASSAEIGAASRNMLGGLQDQTFKIESSTAAITELSASIQQVATNANDAAQVAEKTNTAVSDAVQRMQQIRGSVVQASARMAELGESSKRIGHIVEVIRQISEQTSLLALNASIEAAHAGEQGRGFAVVADEVSSLARRVGQSAKDIEALIQTVKQQTSDAIASMEVGTSDVESGTLLVTNTLQDLGDLITTVNDTATAVQEQAEVSDEIARNMDAVQTIASELVVGSEEAVQQGEQLHTLAFELERSVGGFNLDGDPEPSAQKKIITSASRAELTNGDD